MRFVDQESFVALKRMDWKQVFNWVGEVAPIQSEGNKGWQKQLVSRKAEIAAMKQAGVVKGPTDVETRRGDGLEAHSVENIQEAVRMGVAHTTIDVTGLPGGNAGPVVQVTREAQTGVLPSTVVSSWVPAPGMAPPQGIVCQAPPPPPGPPSSTW